MLKKRILLCSAAGITFFVILMTTLVPQAEGRGKIYGKPIDQNAGQVVELSKLFSQTGDYVGKNVVVEARIGMVCQTSGCWITLTDGANQLLVQFYDFTVRLTPGALVKVRGQVRLRNKAPYLAGQGLEIRG